MNKNLTLPELDYLDDITYCIEIDRRTTSIPH